MARKQKTHREQVQDVIDRFGSAVETGRLRATLVEDLEEEPFTQIEEWAGSLAEIASAIEDARGAIEEWRDAERQDREDARDRALEALESLVSVWNNSPLDVCALQAWEPEGDL